MSGQPEHRFSSTSIARFVTACLAPLLVYRFLASPANSANSAVFLLPVSFDQDPAVTAVLPAMRDPDRVAMRGANPAAVNPDVTVAVPAVITVDPDPTFMRWMVMDFDDRLGGSHADYDLRESSGRNETDSK